ncbi:hypothetical protein BDR04DRAFT_1088943 [Suillus decipiens]|nr:hypothetical protein BDR04DRAFT_1088943 [Suillus decipiens]
MDIEPKYTLGIATIESSATRNISAPLPVFSMNHATQINFLPTGYHKYSHRRVKWLLLRSGYPEKQPTIGS